MRKFAQLTFTILALALVSLVASAPAQAQTNLDPPLFVGNSSTCPNNTSCPFLSSMGGGEIIGISGTSATLFLNGNNGPTGTTILMIVGVPNVTNLTFTAPTGSTPSAGWSLSGPTYGGSFSSGNSVYSFLSLGGDSGGAASESFGNWSGADSTLLGITASGYGIFVYSLTVTTTGTPLTNKGDFVQVNFSSALPEGTFVVGYSCTTTPFSSCTSPDTFSTPFTHAGLVNGGQTPEPGSLALLGTGLLALGGAIRRRWSSS